MFFQVQFIQTRRICGVGGCGRDVVDQNDQACILCAVHKCNTRGCNSACLLGRSAFCKRCTAVVTEQQHHTLPVVYIVQQVTIPQFVMQAQVAQQRMVQQLAAANHFATQAAAAQQAHFNSTQPRLCPKCRHMFVSRIRDETYCVNCASVGYCSF